MWEYILRILDDGGRSIKLDQPEIINMDPPRMYYIAAQEGIGL